MTMRRLLALLPFALAGCAGHLAAPPAPIEVGILAINDFHGNLQPPHLAIQAPGGTVAVPAGGAAYLASAIATLRRGHPASITVSAGDMTGASPLASSLFLDEPTVATMNAIGVDLNAAGNHEFDRGAKELLRLQNGGCDRNANAAPCQLDRFPGARFRYLAGNTITADGTSLLPATAIRRFGTGARGVTIGFIGLTTRTTGGLTNPVGIPGISFADEAETANRLVPELRRAGADTIVLLIHEGGYPKPETDPNACDGLSGPIVEIAARLDPAIQVIVSGHTHKAYVCESVGGRPLLLTSAGKYGTLVTDITLRFDPASKRLIGSGARNVIVQGEGFDAVTTTDAAPQFAADPAVAAIVDRYVAAAGPLADRPVGTIAAGPVTKTNPDKSYESRLGNLVADAQLAATTAAGAQIAFMNPGGLRTDLNAAADGRVRYADIYAVQPFGNWLVVRELTGAQIRTILESQFEREDTPLVLSVAGMTYAFDRSRPAGRRVLSPVVQGRPLDDTARYRIAISNFLAGGGDAFPGFTAGREVFSGMIDVDALAAYLRDRPALIPPAADRIVDRTPAGWHPPAAR